MEISITKIEGIDGEKIVAVTPYNPDWPALAKRIGGRWNPEIKAWTFNPRDEDKVRELAIRLFGTDGETGMAATVTVQYDIYSAFNNYTDDCWLFGRKIAWRPKRDDTVRLGDGVIILKGGFKPSGGSMKYPEIAPLDGTILEIRDVPAGHADLNDPCVMVVEQTTDREALIKERDKLLVRLAEIDELLKN